MNRNDAIWLAGYLEGEGSFVFNHKSSSVEVTSTDLDVVERASLLMASSTPKIKPTKGGIKTAYRTVATGERALRVMHTVFPYMGYRRSLAILSVVFRCAIRPGLRRGETHPRAKLTTEQVKEIKRRCAEGEMQLTLANEHGLSPSTISMIVMGKNWAHIKTP